MKQNCRLFYASSHPVDEASGIMFSGGLSVCVCDCMPVDVRRHSPTRLPSTSSLLVTNALY